MFVSGDTVRYQASKQTGVFPVTYTVKDNLGNSASGTITITVHQKDAKNKAAPTPQDVEAQVAAGQKVRIPITLTGIDVDGDDDQLLGLGNKAPQLGRITEVGANYMIYEAYEDSSGTDTFSYAVEDWTGQRAQAQVRVGVFQGRVRLRRVRAGRRDHAAPAHGGHGAGDAQRHFRGQHRSDRFEETGVTGYLRGEREGQHGSRSPRPTRRERSTSCTRSPIRPA